MPRGKKSKLMKIKEKYKDQDETEKELRMQLLGVGLSKNLLFYLLKFSLIQ